MNILYQKQQFFNRIFVHIPKQVQKLFTCGFSSLTLQPITSVRGNARQVIANFNTAKTKAYRLTSNKRWIDIFPALLAHVKLVTPENVVAVDFSDFLGFQVLTFAVQTNKGRAIPVYIELLKYPITEGSQNLFIITAIERFVSFVGCRPKLVMDRGFACPHIIKELAKQSHPFIVRIKQDKYLTAEETHLLFKAKESGTTDQRVTAYEETKLRLVVSDQPEGDGQRWYLLTNDFTSSRDDLIHEYYHRFEIEEFFKDAKWLCGFEHLQLKTKQSVTVVLWFLILGFWFMAELDEIETAFRGKTTHLISFPRFVLEQLQREMRELVTATLQSYAKKV